MCFNSATVRPPAADILHLKMISVSLIEGMWRQDDLAGEWADLSDLRILVCYLKHGTNLYAAAANHGKKQYQSTQSEWWLHL